MTADLTNPIFTDEAAARAYLEASRWPNGPVCPHCGSVDDNIKKLAGKSHRPGLYACNGCRGHFSVTVGTVYERSHIPLNKWLLATHMLCAGKKGTSAHQIHRMLGITYKSAWFMCHRIREAMTDTSTEPMGGAGKHVEADETYIGRKAGRPIKQGPTHKQTVLSLVERGGKVKSFKIDMATVATVAPLLVKNLDIESTLNTDESSVYTRVGKGFAGHQVVKHRAKEYVRGTAYTNTLEGFFSVFKRGMKGVYQHCDEKHLHRYLKEFDFRYNNRAKLGMTDRERADKAVKGIEGKRLTYRRINERTATPSMG